MLCRRPVFIRSKEELWFEAGGLWQMPPSYSPPCASLPVVVINQYFTPAFILHLLFVIFGEGSSLLAHLETYFIAEEKGTIQVFISD